jgi:hypothetical protein
VDTCGHNIQINAFYISSCAFARVEPSRKDDTRDETVTTQKVRMKATKPAPYMLIPAATSRIKVARLLPMSSDAGSHIWGVCGASESFSFQPTGGLKDAQIKDVKLSMVLGEFAVLEILSQWPVLQLRLSKAAEAVMTAYQETHINPAS